jgi:integrase
MKVSQFDGGAVQLYQLKTRTYMWMPAPNRLIQHLARVTGEYMLESNRGSRYTDQSLNRLIREACVGLGYPACVSWRARRWRKRAAQSIEIMSILGHLTESETMNYVKQANRKKMAASAMAKWNVNSE